MPGHGGLDGKMREEQEWKKDRAMERVRPEDTLMRRQRISEEQEIGQKEEKNKKISKKSMMKELLYNSLFLLFVLFVTLLMVKYVAQRTTVSGSSMEPMIHDGDSLIVDKIT